MNNFNNNTQTIYLTQQSSCDSSLFKINLNIESNSTQLAEDTIEQMVQSIEMKRTKKIGKQIKLSNKWTNQQTIKLLNLMKIFGVDFYLIALHLKTKNRDQIKRRYNVLEKTQKATLDEFFAGKMERLDINMQQASERMIAQVAI